MRVHSMEKIEELKKLRKRGFSIAELVAKLSIPKTTVWHHIHDIKILPKYVQILKARQGGSRRRAQENWEKARKLAQKLLCGNTRELSITLAMLYWGEGSKKACEFINSDGRIIETYLFILRTVLNIPEELIKPTMRIFSGMDRAGCLNYWSHVTKIPKRRFLIRFNDGGTRGKTKYGMCRITVKKGASTLKTIHSLIEQFFKETIQRH